MSRLDRILDFALEATVIGAAVALLALMAFVVLAQTFGPDRGACLASHDETYAYTTTLQVGSVMVPMLQTGISSVCDRWEFPEGRPQ